MVHVGPCILLVLLNGRLVIELLVSIQRREKLGLHTSRTDLRITLMLVTIVFLFLLVAVPSAAIIGYFTFANVPKEAAAVSVSVINFLLLVSYSVYILIFLLMSNQFRDVFNKKFGCYKKTIASNSDQAQTSNFLRKKDRINALPENNTSYMSNVKISNQMRVLPTRANSFNQQVMQNPTTSLLSLPLKRSASITSSNMKIIRL